MSWILAHGVLDDGITNEKKCEKALCKKIICSCGSAALWVSSVLKKFNINSRLVVGLTLDKWNSYDNGHTMLEILMGNKWVVYDVSNHVFFRDELHYLDMYELCSIVSNNQNYDIISLTGSSQYDINTSYALWHESIMSSEECLRKWYKRVLQIPLIGQNNIFYFCNAKNKDRIETYGYISCQYIEKDKFMKEFYYVSNKGD